MVPIPVVADSHIFGEPHLSEKLGPDPDPHYSQKLDPQPWFKKCLSTLLTFLSLSIVNEQSHEMNFIKA